MARIIWILIGTTVVGTVTNKSAMAIANTDNTNHPNIIINIKKIIRAFLLITKLLISAMVFPFSLKLITNAPKSWTAPIKIVPKTIQRNAGNHPQYAAIQGPMIGAAPAMEVKWCPIKIFFGVGK